MPKVYIPCVVLGVIGFDVGRKKQSSAQIDNDLWKFLI